MANSQIDRKNTKQYYTEKQPLYTRKNLNEKFNNLFGFVEDINDEFKKLNTNYIDVITSIRDENLIDKNLNNIPQTKEIEFYYNDIKMDDKKPLPYYQQLIRFLLNMNPLVKGNWKQMLESFGLYGQIRIVIREGKTFLVLEKDMDPLVKIIFKKIVKFYNIQEVVFEELDYSMFEKKRIYAPYFDKTTSKYNHIYFYQNLKDYLLGDVINRIPVVDFAWTLPDINTLEITKARRHGSRTVYDVVYNHFESSEKIVWLLQYLKTQDIEERTKWATKFVDVFDSHRVDNQAYNTIWKIMPYESTRDLGVDTPGKPIIGGYVHNYTVAGNPKPSEFMTMGSKFKDKDAVVKAFLLLIDNYPWDITDDNPWKHRRVR